MDSNFHITTAEIPTPFIDVSVSNFSQLSNAITTASVGYALNITVTASFAITGPLTLNTHSTVSISSGTGGPYTLIRNTTGNLFTITALNYNGLSLSNIILDGNSQDYPSAGGALIRGGTGTTITIGPGTVLRNNFRGSAPEPGAGAVDARSATLVMTGGLITGNRGSSGGGISTDHGSFQMYDGIIENNTAQYAGGGVYNGYQMFVFHRGIIRNNAAIQQNGGGISLDNAPLIIYDGIIQDNSAGMDGGGVDVAGYSGAIAIHGGLIDNNIALNGDGGGICLTSSSPSFPTYEIDGDTVFTNNAAPSGNGGAIGIRYEENLSILNIGPEVVFSNNSAAQAYQIASADIPLHNAHVLTRSFTNPFAYGYNNYDIQYTRGTPVDIVTVDFESGGGSSVPSQPAISGSPIAEPPTPARPGYAFCGWYTDPGLNTPWNFANPVITSITLYACWTPFVPGEHVVTFNSNGGSFVPDQIVPEGSLVVQPPNPTRGSDVFVGWYIDPDLTIPWNFSTPVYADMTLYARWAPASCPPECPPVCLCPPICLRICPTMCPCGRPRKCMPFNCCCRCRCTPPRFPNG